MAAPGGIPAGGCLLPFSGKAAGILSRSPRMGA